MKESESILHEAATASSSSPQAVGASVVDPSAVSDVETSSWQGQLPDEFFTTLIKYIGIGEILTKLLPLNRKLRELVLSENYLLFKHFLRNFNMHSDRLKRSDIPARIDIL